MNLSVFISENLYDEFAEGMLIHFISLGRSHEILSEVEFLQGGKKIKE